MRIDELKIKIASLAFEAATIHRDENKHRERARRFERYRRLLDTEGRPPRPIPESLTDEQLKRALRTRANREREATRLDRLYAWLDQQPNEMGDEVAKRLGGHARATWSSLREHRKGPVRSEARASLLAYGFLRAREYYELEAQNTVADDVPWEQARVLANRFAEAARKEHVDRLFAAWQQAGEDYLAEKTEDPRRLEHEMDQRRAAQK